MTHPWRTIPLIILAAVLLFAAGFIGGFLLYLAAPLGARASW